MSQYDFGTIDPQVKDGTQLAADLNSWRDALHTTHMGVARPAYVKPGMLWIDASLSPVFILKLFDGVADVQILDFNNTTHLFNIAASNKYDITGGPIYGDVTIIGNGRRIRGGFDTSGGTLSSRLAFQSSQPNALSVITVLPSGTGVGSYIQAFSSSDVENSRFISLYCNATTAAIGAEKSGSATYVPLEFATSGVLRQRLTVNGAVVIGNGSPIFDVAGALSILSTNTGVPLAMRNTNVAAGRYWQVGPDGSNNFLVVNDAGAGQYIPAAGGAWATPSDERMKTALTPISGNDLWAWFKTVRTENGRFLADNEGTQRAFLIAQDWTDRPEVTSQGADEMLGISSANTLPYAYAVLKTAMERIEALEARVAALGG